MKKLIYLFAILAIVSCKKPAKEPLPNTSTVSIIGTWKTTSMHGKFYENNSLTIDTTINAPYTNEIDIIETIRFTNSMVFLKMNNDSSEGEYYNYSITNNYVMISDSISSDTLLYINSLSLTNFDFTLDYVNEYYDSTAVLFMYYFLRSIELF